MFIYLGSHEKLHQSELIMSQAWNCFIDLLWLVRWLPGLRWVWGERSVVWACPLRTVSLPGPRSLYTHPLLILLLHPAPAFWFLTLIYASSLTLALWWSHLSLSQRLLQGKNDKLAKAPPTTYSCNVAKCLNKSLFSKNDFLLCRIFQNFASSKLLVNVMWEEEQFPVSHKIDNFATRP